MVIGYKRFKKQDNHLYIILEICLKMDSGPHQEVEKDWDWSLCEYDIKKVTDQTETIWNLKSSI